MAVGTNIGHIAAASQEAKRRYQTYSRSDIPEELLDPAVYVRLNPQDPTLRNDRIVWTSPLKHVVLKSGSGDTAAQPEKIETTPVGWTNATNNFEGTSASAVFDLDPAQHLRTRPRQDANERPLKQYS